MRLDRSVIALSMAALVLVSPALMVEAGRAQSSVPGTETAQPAEPAKAEKKRRSWRDLVPAVTGVVGAVGGALLCNQIGRQTGMSDSERAAFMVQCAALAGAGSYVLGNQLKKHLVEQDQIRMVAAMRKSIRTGEPQTLELPDSGALAEISSGEAFREVRQAELEYDPALVEKLPEPLLFVLDQTHVATAAQDLRSGPAASFKVVSTQPANAPFQVMGRIKDTEWLLVGVDGVAVGYVLGGPRVRTTNNAVQASTRAATAAVQKANIQADLPCRAMEVEVDFSDTAKQDVEQQNRLCTGPSGATILATAA